MVAEPKQTTMEVSDIHKQHISIKLRSLERTLNDVQSALGGMPPHSPVTEYCDPIPTQIRADVSSLLGQARSEIEEIAAHLDLPVHEESIARSLIGELHVRAISAVELHPRYLRSGGAVPPTLASYMEEKANRIESIVRRLITWLEPTPSRFQDGARR